jgi:hypothetical protein
VPIVENFDLYKITVSDNMRHILASYLNYAVKEHLAHFFLLEVLREFYIHEMAALTPHSGGLMTRLVNGA